MARPKKEAQPKKPDPDARVNSDLTDDERRSLFLQGIAEIEREQKKKAELVNPIDAKIKLARKRLKAEGFPKDEVDDGLRQRKMEPEQVMAAVQSRFRVARWLGFAPGYQANLFGDGVDRTPVLERAYGEGRTAGMSGDDPKAPEKFAPGSDTANEWMRGWHDGQEVLLSALAKRKPVDLEEAEGEGMPDAEGDETVHETEDA